MKRSREITRNYYIFAVDMRHDIKTTIKIIYVQRFRHRCRWFCCLTASTLQRTNRSARIYSFRNHWFVCQSVFLSLFITLSPFSVPAFQNSICYGRLICFLCVSFLHAKLSYAYDMYVFRFML